MHQSEIGRQLDAAGWTQGVLIDPLVISIVFTLDQPVSKIARAAAAVPGSRVPSAQQRGRAVPPHHLGFGFLKSTERLVIVSQACDIIKPLNDDPNVVAMPVFATTNAPILKSAVTNSARYFLLDEARGLVVDSSYFITIEKPVLLGLQPEVGAPTEEARRRFARWVARRFNRPALPDPIVAAIVSPMLDNLRALHQQGQLDFATLDHIEEVRIRLVTSGLPYVFDLLFIVPDGLADDVELGLAALVGLMRSWFTPAAARLAEWYALPLSGISVADYLATEQLYLDEYSYRGGTVRGLLPREPA